MFHRLMNRLIVCAMPCGVVLGGVVACAVGQGPVDQHATAEELIRQLDADRYEPRMIATRALIALGERAINPLKAAMGAQPSLELQSRGLEVLERLARDETQLQGGPAHEALRTIAANEQGSLALRAAGKLKQLKTHRRGQALEHLKSAGAVVSMSWNQPLGGPAVVRQIEIGPEWKGTADDIRWLAWAGQVQTVIFDGPHVTNDYLRPLTALDSVFEVDIKRASVDDAGIAILTSLPRCNTLWLKHTPVTDAAIDDLVKIPAADLKLYGTKISKHGHARLIQMLAGGAMLDFRRGGFFGVGPSSVGEPANVTLLLVYRWLNPVMAPTMGFQIGNVQENTAAQRAGFRLGDIIFKYDGVEVRQFEQVRDLIAKNEVGAKVEVEYLRRGRKQKTIVTLGEWP